MAKQVDYWVSGIKRDNEQTQITHLKVHKNENMKTGKEEIWTSEEVAQGIFAGKTFHTIFKKNGGEYTAGGIVEVFLRTKENSTTKDNLESLPEF